MLILYIVPQIKYKCSGDKPDFGTRNPLAAVMGRIRKLSRPGISPAEIFVDGCGRN
ncbi:hypothetical protein ES703_54029 [subsurface metagenome]